ncbi:MULTISPECIES: META domain-containing protein [unclassified Acinetobacter]|uniref:META domain-containing protein n=1 Tax=unclassified Acinetobacter TaxID=196816 RepID=UPI0035BB35F6
MRSSQHLSRLGVIVATTVLLAACASTLPAQHKPQVKYQTTKTPANKVNLSPTPAPLPTMASRDGLQDIRWNIQQINGRQANYFVQYPSLMLQSQTQRIFGHTGCNAIFGEYRFNPSNQTMQIRAGAEHQACDNALAQEAELMDVLSRVAGYSVQANNLVLFDANRNVLLRANY